jgi:hypothetical protein
MKNLLALCLLTLTLSACSPVPEHIDAEVFIQAETDCTLRGGLDIVRTSTVPAANGYWYYTAECKNGTSVNSGVKDT